MAASLEHPSLENLPTRAPRVKPALADVIDPAGSLNASAVAPDHVAVDVDRATRSRAREVVAQAQQRLSERHGVNPIDAFDSLRAYARNHDLTLAVVARRTVDGVLDPWLAESNARDWDGRELA